MTDPIRLGTRASQLARTQSATVGDALAGISGRAWTEVLVRTPGDDTTRSLDQPGSPGLFVSTLRRALLSGEVDVIVHSFKDLPSAAEPGITIAAVPARVDPRDALVSRGNGRLADLATGSVVGTSSPRRAAAVARLRPDLVIRPIRGNVDTRIRKVREGEYDAAILAVAGLARIGRSEEIAEILDALTPAPAQGALAVECRSDDADMLSWLALLDDAPSRLVTAAERHVLVAINAACTTAVGALATYGDGTLTLDADLVVDSVHTSARVAVPCSLGDLATAREVGLRASVALRSPGSPVVLLVRSEGNEADADQLSAAGIASITEPYVRIVPTVGAEGHALARTLSSCADDPDLARTTWLVATSPMTVPSWLATNGRLADVVAQAAASGVRAAATGERTAATLRELGFGEVLTPGESSAVGLVRALADQEGSRALFPRGNLALLTLPAGLRELGWQVDEAVVYETSTVVEQPSSVRLIDDGTIGVIVVRSPSAVRALVAHAKVPVSVAIVCGGRTTAEAARDAGLSVAAVAASASSEDVMRAVLSIVR